MTLVRKLRVGSCLVVVFACMLAGCGGNGMSSNPGGGACPSAIAAITPEQIRMYSGAQVVALGTNIRCLNDAALGALSGNSNAGTGHIYAITVEQIAVLSPAQVRMLGATGEGGATTTSKLSNLNPGAWAALAGSTPQVAAITAPEIRTLSPEQIKVLGINIKSLTDAALGALSTNSNAGTGHIYAITVEQIAVLTPVQIGVIAAINNDAGIANLNMAAFSSLTAAQIGVLTSAQKAALSPAQHTACGC